LTKLGKIAGEGILACGFPGKFGLLLGDALAGGCQLLLQLIQASQGRDRASAGRGAGQLLHQGRVGFQQILR
jgi:hypothetical protein